jgi:serine phosphatase RsbU (regulator of sigma subunit)
VYGGLPLGFGMPTAFTTQTVSLEPGAAVLFYTDGLTEFKRDVERAERAVLQAVTLLVESTAVDHPATFIQRRVMGSERPTDDTVLLVVRLSSRVPALN